MSEMSGKYNEIMQELESNIKDPEELKFVKDKFSDLSMLFVDMLDRITKLTDDRIQEIETKQQEIMGKIQSVQSTVKGIENDIYEDEEENYEFEIVCPYCNHEFSADIEEEENDEIRCPECHNIIELDWNCEEEVEGCHGSCSHCHTNCGVAEDEQEYLPEKDDEEDKNKDQDEDM